MNLRIERPVNSLTQAQVSQFETLMNLLKLAHIEVVSYSGQRQRPGPAPNTRYNLVFGAGMDTERLHFRFDVEATMMGQDGDPVATVQAAIVVTFQLPEGVTPPDWAIQRISRTATQMVYPHLRETIQSLSTRLGYFGVLLPMAIFEPEDTPMASASAPDSDS